ncbi:Dihydrofolate synthase/folylpolyglutamate synthase [Buchnera aphidicola (Eriosoma lanigerum)]|uniref:bifunctional tetrahydrofolate synthase/dihydrofolate synthase n=1 Tax=Buchnera aphidicola TaxID=9 RepID=UPI003464B4EA
MKTKIINNNDESYNIKLSVWLQYLEKKCKNISTKSLSNVKCVANNLNLLQTNAFVFIVTGTNGKGTSCIVLEQLLLESGYRVGLYTSPHLIHYNERIRINGHVVDAYKHILAFSEIEKVSKKVELTYFEFITLSSLFIFKQENLDVLILEVGIGGRLDATNILDADIAVITNIAMDHMDVLGSDLDSIGYEKSGIFRTGKIAIIAEQCIPNSIYKIVKEKKILLKKIGYDWNWKIYDNTWDFFYKKKCFDNLPIPSLSLENVATSIAALSFSNFNISKKIITNVVKRTHIPGRFHIILNQPLVILDVCHNPHAAKYLSHQLSQIKKDKIIHAVVGMLNNKDILGTISPFLSLIKFWYCSSVNSERSMLGCDLIKYLPITNSRVFNKISNAFLSALNNAQLSDIIIVFGSFLTVSEVLSMFSKNII